MPFVVYDHPPQFVVGPDAGVSDGNFDLSVVADFDSAQDYQTYATHPAHQEVIKSLIKPILENRAAVQHHVTP